MMLPDHCKDVSVREVGFKLTLENILANAKDKKAYTRTEFIILRRGDEHAIVRVEKQEGKDLFRPIISVEVLALPKDTAFVKDEDVDVLNLSQMARETMKHPGRIVIVQGLFNHVSFMGPGAGVEVRVFDVVPPFPAKLSVLVEMALSAGLVDVPIVPVVETLDLNVLAQGSSSDTIMFPCRASGLEAEGRILYLDETPDFDGEVALIGCDLSKRIFQNIYRRRPASFVNMCPEDLAPKDGRKRIIKCCRVRDGFQIKGDVAIVPWGATVQEVGAALTALVGPRE